MGDTISRWLQIMRGQALQARREMLRAGELLSEHEFRRRRNVSTSQLARLISSGSVFSIEVDGKAHYPALLVDPAYDLRRLASICRVLWPAPPDARLDFLTSQHGALGGMTPLQVLADDDSYRELRIVATGWALEFSRTVVKIFDGEFACGIALPIVCTGTAEIDPRTKIWRRAAEALEDGGNLRPDGPYPRVKAATVFVFQSTAGNPQEVAEARLDVTVEKDHAHTGIMTSKYPRFDLSPVRVETADDVVTIVRKVLEACK